MWVVKKKEKREVREKMRKTKKDLHGNVESIKG